ncbi:MAG: arginine--tRNA ligase [Gammaproteobacteria bacterium]
MKSIKETVISLFNTAINDTYHVDIDPVIQIAGRPEFGDFQANFALSLAKRLQLKPVDIAKQIIEQLKQHAIFEKLECSGPGFINITLSNSFLAEHLQRITADTRLGMDVDHSPRTIVIDYGGANVAKEMHVGHLRSAIIGDAFVRILEFVGHHVIRQNHLGDWGTQFGMLIEYLIKTNWQADQSHAYSDLNALYKQAKQQFDQDPAFADRARQRVVMLQAGDATSRAIWQQLVAESKHHFQEIYDKLGVKLTENDAAGESIYNDMLQPLTQELEKNGDAQIDEGALVIALDGFVDPDGKPVPFLIRKQDGGFLYATTDMAAIKYRINVLHATQIIYVVDTRQKQHFAMLFAAAKKAFDLPDNIMLEHTAYGAVLGEDHKPLKTRSGESIKLIDLLNEAEKRAAEIVSQKHPDLSAAELSDIARSVGIGALKYADLRSDKIKDYVFSWDKMLAFEGNTGPYLQNACVRIHALFRKGQIDRHQIKQKIIINSPFEHVLAIKLSAFPDIIHTVANNLQLHTLCDYLYDLASTFHRFYEHCPVLSDNEIAIRDSRLALCSLTVNTLALGLDLLGINVLEKM